MKTHNLIVITSYPHGYSDEEAVVRWCTNCGVVVVDLDIDNRTAPGRLVKMKTPRIATDPLICQAP